MLHADFWFSFTKNMRHMLHMYFKSNIYYLYRIIVFQNMIKVSLLHDVNDAKTFPKILIYTIINWTQLYTRP